MKVLEVIKNFVEKLFSSLLSMDNLKSVADTVERVVEKKVQKFIRRLTLGLLNLFFVMVGIAFVLVGAVLYLSRFFPIDYVLLSTGLLILYIVWLSTIIKVK